VADQFHRVEGLRQGQWSSVEPLLTDHQRAVTGHLEPGNPMGGHLACLRLSSRGLGRACQVGLGRLPGTARAAMLLATVGGPTQLRFQFVFGPIKCKHLLGSVPGGSDHRPPAPQCDLTANIAVRVAFGIGCGELDLGADYALTQSRDGGIEPIAHLLASRVADREAPASDTDVHHRSFPRGWPGRPAVCVPIGHAPDKHLARSRGSHLPGAGPGSMRHQIVPCTNVTHPIDPSAGFRRSPRARPPGDRTLAVPGRPRRPWNRW